MQPKAPPPFVWTILYLPFGALSGFIGVPLTFIATQSGLSISEGSLLTASSLLSQWLKWIWAPAVDVSLSPKIWYTIATLFTSLTVLTLCLIPMGPDTLPLLLLIIAIGSLVNSIVGMAIESMLAGLVPKEKHGETSAWFQAGNLGGSGLGGGLGMTLFTTLPERWMTGAVMAALFASCCLALVALPDVRAHSHPRGMGGAVGEVFKDIGRLARTKGGLLAAVICFLPLGTGAAQGTLAQSAVAALWGANEVHVAWIQGYTAAAVTAAGCFAGGYLCDRVHPRTAYLGIGALLALVATAMAFGPREVGWYIGGNLVYAFVVGLAYAAFTALVLNAIGTKAGATRYSLYASLSNFPIFWVGLVLGRVADLYGSTELLLTEAALGLAGVVVFVATQPAVQRTSLPEHLDEATA